MLFQITIAVDDDQLSRTLQDLMQDSTRIIKTIRARKVSWKKLLSGPCDLLIVSRNHIPKRSTRIIPLSQEILEVPALVVITSQENPTDRARLIALGCDAVLNADVSNQKLKEALQAIIDKRCQIMITALTPYKKLDKPSLGDFISKSSAMKKFMSVVHRVVKSNSSVFLLGETGVGKERLAHAIHVEGPRTKGPFLAVNCGALPESLLESELFGHEKGSFTGATRSRRGCFELAHQGTIFLDEIAEMPLHLQVKLLRVLETKQIHSIGSERYIPTDVRIMAATNREIEEEVRSHRFRKDLYYRLNVVTLTIPPLRERREDIPELVYSYIHYLGPRIGSEVTKISTDALEILCHYSWPGNVRELINVIERAMLLSETDKITIAELPASITGQLALPPVPIPTEENPEALSCLPEEWLKKSLKEAKKILNEQFEYRYLTTLLKLTGGRVGLTARKAGIDERTLFNKMQYYKLDKDDFRSD